MLTQRRAAWSRLARNRRGSVAVEFAIVLPVMSMMLIGVYDITEALIIKQQVYNTAHTIAVSASSLAVQADKSTSLTPLQVQQSLSAVFAEMPQRRSGILTGITSVTLSSINFVLQNAQCQPGGAKACAYDAQTAWSVGYSDPAGRYPGNNNSFTLALRPCGTIKQVGAANLVPGDLASIPTAGVDMPDPIIVADVHFRYTPLFLTYIGKPLDFWAAVYWPARSVNSNASYDQQYTKYDITNSKGGAGKCLPGYP